MGARQKNARGGEPVALLAQHLELHVVGSIHVVDWWLSMLLTWHNPWISTWTCMWGEHSLFLIIPCEGGVLPVTTERVELCVGDRSPEPPRNKCYEIAGCAQSNHVRATHTRVVTATRRVSSDALKESAGYSYCMDVGQKLSSCNNVAD